MVFDLNVFVVSVEWFPAGVLETVNCQAKNEKHLIYMLDKSVLDEYFKKNVREMNY